MTNKGSFAFVGCIAVFLGVLISASVASAQSAVWLTRPSEQRQLSFVRPGLVKEVLVEEGEYVKAGQQLMRLDDTVEVEQLKILELLAKDDVNIRYAKSVCDQAKVDLQKYKLLAKSNNANTYEVEHAELEVTKTQASLDKAKLDMQQAIGDRDVLKARIDQMHLLSPINGRVEQIKLKAGEAVDAQEKILLILCTDPLWIDLPVPLDYAKNVSSGDTVLVKFLKTNGGSLIGSDDEYSQLPPADAVAAEVLYKATLADTAGKIKVRVEVPNPDNIPAGGKVQIWFGKAAQRAEADKNPENTAQQAEEKAAPERVEAEKTE